MDGGPPAVRGKVPSFSAWCNVAGWSIGGLPTFDRMAEMPAAELATFLRAGGAGSVPRNIDTATMRHLIRWVRRNSIEHVRRATAGTAVAWLAEADGVQ